MHNEWSYNEWPDVDINGNVISKNIVSNGKRLTESCNRRHLSGRYLKEGINGGIKLVFIYPDGSEDVKDYDSALVALDAIDEYEANATNRRDKSTFEHLGCAIIECTPDYVDKTGTHVYKIHISNDFKDCTRGECLRESADEEEIPEEEISEEEIEGEVENLKDCLIAALEEIEIPEDEELDPKVVLDAIVGCLADEDKEYLCSILCPEEEAEDDLAELEEPEESEDEIEESCRK